MRAVEETEVLELLRNVLHMLQKNKAFKAELDRRYRERALETHLRSVPLLAGLSDAFIGGCATASSWCASSRAR